MGTKVQSWTPAFRLYVGFVAFSILGTLLSKATGLDPGPVKPIAAVLTLAFGVAAVILPVWRTVPNWVLAAVLAIGAGSEIVGLYTGLPFGDYLYTGNWQPSVELPGGKSFPIPLPFAWLMMAAGGYLAALRFGAGIWALLVGPVIATLVDLAIEPAATGPLAYWTWQDRSVPWLGAAPVQNYVGWLATSFCAAAVLRRAGVRECSSWEPVAVLGLHVLLMALLWILR